MKTLHRLRKQVKCNYRSVAGTGVHLNATPEFMRLEVFFYSHSFMADRRRPNLFYQVFFIGSFLTNLCCFLTLTLV